ncbi:MAG: KilA-N domain-containing protein [Candidatus Margulisbacteria bacterium]|nr:KilA-N domain-containing protein [Candidatus Margulisiibacteriota bacterium]
MKSKDGDFFISDWLRNRNTVEFLSIWEELHNPNFIYASEGDLLNVSLFGKTAKQWREEHPDLNGNIRDFATLEQLIVLSNLESVNSIFISQGLDQKERLKNLNNIAISQMKSLVGNKLIKKIN